MRNELFEKVFELDNSMNTAAENGDFDLCDKLQEEQDEIVNEIESLGLRDEFDAVVESMN